MKMQDVRDWLIALAVFICMMMMSYFIGQCAGRADAENEQIAKADTVIQKDTIRVPVEKLETQVVTQEVVRYKYVPISVSAVPDTVIKHDTIIRVENGVAVIPISLKTYTDSSTYKAVISGYEPRLEEIEVYRDNVVITKTIEPKRLTWGFQGGMFITPKGLQPGVGVGVQWRITK